MSGPKPTIEEILRASADPRQRRAVRQRHEKFLRDQSKPKCTACLYHYCTFCSRLRTELGFKMNPCHCQKHCRHKSKRHVLSVVRVLDIRSKKGVAIK